ncbi:MAG: FIST signal transduction protein [Phormidesmis sp.]
MGTQIGVGISHHRNPRMAGKEAVMQANQQAALSAEGDERPDLVMLFATVAYPQRVLLASVREATGQAPLIGCSSAGVIAPDVADESNFSVTVLVIKSDEMHFSHGHSIGLKADSAQVGQIIGEAIDTADASTEQPAQALFLFLDGMTPNFDAFMSGLRSVTPLEKSIPAIGGFAADHIAFRKTVQYCDDAVFSDGAVWALLAGDVRVASVVSHGCVPLGAKHTVTKSDRNIVYEVDHQPVLEVLENYLMKSEIDDWGMAAVNLGWGFDRVDATADDDKIIRCLISKDEETQSVHVFSEIPVGTEFWVTRRDLEKNYDKADQMRDALMNAMGDDVPKLIFQVECDGRGKVIFREQEKLALLKRLQHPMLSGRNADVPWIGLYAFAEIGPTCEQNYLHNFASVLSAIY